MENQSAPRPAPETAAPNLGANPYVKLGVPLAVLLVLAALSFFVVAGVAGSTEHHADTIAALDAKKTTVMELTAASTAASAAITLLPGDTATPIADKLADFSGYFLVVLCAIYLEKYLVTITGYAAFKFLFPAACLALAVNLFAKRPALAGLAKKLALLGLALVLVIPASVAVSGMIETTYSASIQQTLDTARQTTQDLEQEAEAAEDEQDQGLLSGLVSQVQQGVTDAAAQVENTLNRFVEALAVMLVTSCLIPVLVLLFFAWLIKIILGVDWTLPRARG